MSTPPTPQLRHGSLYLYLTSIYTCNCILNDSRRNSHRPVQTALIQHIDILHEDTEEWYNYLKQHTTHAEFWLCTVSSYTKTIHCIINMRYANTNLLAT